MKKDSNHGGDSNIDINMSINAVNNVNYILFWIINVNYDSKFVPASKATHFSIPPTNLSIRIGARCKSPEINSGKAKSR